MEFGLLSTAKAHRRRPCRLACRWQKPFLCLDRPCTQSTHDRYQQIPDSPPPCYLPPNTTAPSKTLAALLPSNLALSQPRPRRGSQGGDMPSPKAGEARAVLTRKGSSLRRRSGGTPTRVPSSGGPKDDALLLVDQVGASHSWRFVRRQPRRDPACVPAGPRQRAGIDLPPGCRRAAHNPRMPFSVPGLALVLLAPCAPAFRTLTPRLHSAPLPYRSLSRHATAPSACASYPPLSSSLPSWPSSGQGTCPSCSWCWASRRVLGAGCRACAACSALLALPLCPALPAVELRHAGIRCALLMAPTCIALPASPHSEMPMLVGVRSSPCPVLTPHVPLSSATVDSRTFSPLHLTVLNTPPLPSRLQTMMVKELFTLARRAQAESRLPGFRAQQWFFFGVAAFWVYIR